MIVAASRTAALFILATVSQAPAQVPGDDPQPPRAQVIAQLQQADRWVDYIDTRPLQQAAYLRKTINECLARLDSAGVTHDVLSAAMHASRAAASEDGELNALRDGIRRALDLLSFTPTREAGLPEGFPDFTPLGEVEIKVYPSYRMARAPMPAIGGQNIAFWQLFQHIKKHDISMTAPVEMQWSDTGGERPETMAFLYGAPGLGQTGQDGAVQVIDMPAMTVVSVGMRGTMSRTQFATAETRLRQWLANHDESYTVDGPLRTMNWNSPFIPDDRKYYEVQIPICRVAELE